MTSLILTKISPVASDPVLKDFLERHPFVPFFFFSQYTLQTWLNHDSKTLYIAELGDERLLILHKEGAANAEGKRALDIRVLFDHPSSKMVNELMREFNPNYLSVNECVTPPQEGKYLSDIEYEIQLEPVATLADKDLRKKYNQALRKNAGLRYETYKPEHAEDIRMFLQKWNMTRSEHANAYAKTHNDRHFLDLYKDDPKLIGGVVYDGEDIVAYTLSVPDMNGSLLAVFNKVLRGYVQFGIYLYVERTRQLMAHGFSRANIGSINNDFKKQFLDDAVKHDIYCYVLHNELTLKNEERYLRRVF